MTKSLHYLCGVGLIIFGVVMFNWFYLDDFVYSITHLTNPMYFARIFAPIASAYLGFFYLYNVIKNKISSLGRISLYVLVIGLLLSTIIMLFTPFNIGVPTPYYAIILDSIWRTLMPLSIIISILLSFISLFKKNII